MVAYFAAGAKLSRIATMGEEMKEFLSLAGRASYRLMGWGFESLPDYFSNKHVIIGFPHTSNMDTIRAFICFKIIKRTGHIMIKKEWFFWPISMIFHLAGGVPVNRDSSEGAVGQMVNLFNKRERFLLAIVPEGTRKEVTTIKTGFWHIAKSADVSIVCWYLDNPGKRSRWLGEIWPGESKEEDLLKIQGLYEEAGYRVPLEIS